MNMSIQCSLVENYRIRKLLDLITLQQLLLDISTVAEMPSKMLYICLRIWE